VTLCDTVRKLKGSASKNKNKEEITHNNKKTESPLLLSAFLRDLFSTETSTANILLVVVLSNGTLSSSRRKRPYKNQKTSEPERGA
jgi:hypothetical protein